MDPSITLSGIVPLLPEIVLILLPEGRLVSFGGSFVVDDFARFLKILAIIGSAAARLIMTGANSSSASNIQFRAFDARHADVDLGRRPDRALSRPRTYEPPALCGGGEPPHLAALDRGWAQIFRSRRAFVGHAALRRLARLRLHWHRELCRHCALGCLRRHRPDFWPRVPVCRLLLQGVGGAVPYVDPGRVRGRADARHRFLCRRGQSCRHRHVRADSDRRVSGHHRTVAGNRQLRFRRLHVAGLVRCHRPAQLQAPDGLFINRPYGLCADRPCRGHRGRRSGRARLHGDLHHYDPRTLP
jgi:hypothetical protein